VRSRSDKGGIIQAHTAFFVPRAYYFVIHLIGVSHRRMRVGGIWVILSAWKTGRVLIRRETMMTVSIIRFNI
jgi:hypothetical protein